MKLKSSFRQKVTKLAKGKKERKCKKSLLLRCPKVPNLNLCHTKLRMERSCGAAVAVLGPIQEPYRLEQKCTI